MKTNQEIKTTIIRNAQVVTEAGIVQNACLVMHDHSIAYIGSERHIDPALFLGHSVSHIDAERGLLLPGFIDVHIHGGYGFDFMDATKEAILSITRFHAQHGTTSMLATTVTASKEQLEAAFAAIFHYQQQVQPYAQIVGVHVEGPFINSQHKGAQNPAYIVSPRIDWLQQWVNTYPELLKMITLAPETDTDLACVRWLSANGIIPACGHTDADYDTIVRTVDNGLQHAVHTFNAMKGLHHREPGTAGAVMVDDRISAEIIADGRHVHPACIQLLHRAKPRDKILLVTDAMAAAGLGDGHYKLGDLAVTVQDRVAKLTTQETLAGSTLTMIEAFRYVVLNVGINLVHASEMASLNPAKLLGLNHQTGSLQVGKQADVLLLDRDLHLRNVWIKGNSIHDKKGAFPN